MTDYPDSIISVQYHLSDSYTVPIANQRDSFYGVTGTPTTWFDGRISRVGAYTNDSQMYSWYQSAMNTRLGVPTDVTIGLEVNKVGAQSYRVTATVGIEEGGTGKTMVIHFLQVLDHYPDYADNRYRNTARDHSEATVSVAAGDTKSVDSIDFVIDGVDWDNKENVRFVVWAQETGSSAPRDVYQAAVIDLPQPVEGDINGDGKVDLEDLAILLGAYGTCEGDANYNPLADLSSDGCIDLIDLAVLLGNYGYGT